MSADVAARKIINACRYGIPERTLTVAGKLAVVLHGIAPSLMADYFDLVSRFLPEPGSDVRSTGRKSDSILTPEWARKINEEVAKKNNE
jgi:hypothetical protein